jgi:choline dehydrogenase-like flavoprotein
LWKSAGVGVLAASQEFGNAFLTTSLSASENDTQVQFLAVVYDGQRNTSTIEIRVFMVNPKSRGFITISSSDPKSSPIINPNYLSHEADRQNLIEGIQSALALVNKPTFRKINMKVIDLNVKKCQNFELWSVP